MYGKGRVFYSTLGHTDESWQDPDIRKMYFEAIRWALGMTDGSTDVPSEASGEHDSLKLQWLAININGSGVTRQTLESPILHTRPSSYETSSNSIELTDVNPGT